MHTAAVLYNYQILTLWTISTQLSIKTQNNYYKSQFHGNGAANFL